MVFRPLRTLPPVPIAALEDRWLGELADQLAGASGNRYDICRDALTALEDFARIASHVTMLDGRT